MKPSEIEVQIDELVLHGFALGDRARIGRAVERELARLLTRAGAPGGFPSALSSGGAVAFRDAGAFNQAPGGGPEAAGVQVAQAVYRALTGSEVASRPGSNPPRAGSSRRELSSRTPVPAPRGAKP
jgi:hypothetical protein